MTVAALREVCRNYDVDGIELDFMRDTIYFRPTMQLEAVAQKHLDLMNDMMRRIRRMTEEEGLKRGRPFLVAARCADDLILSRSIGLDVETWLKEDLVDVLSAGSWVDFTMPMEATIDVAHRYDVPLYPVVKSFWKADMLKDLAVWRADAMNLFTQGADGIYMFNVFDPTLSLWWELGDPKQLAATDKTYVWDYLPSQREQSDVLPALRLTRFRPPVPVTTQACEPIPLFVGENLQDPGPAGRRRSLTLRIRMKDLTSIHKLRIALNGKPLGEAEISEALTDQPQEVWMQFVPDRELFHVGENLLTAALAGTAGGTAHQVIDEVRLDVRYLDVAED